MFTWKRSQRICLLNVYFPVKIKTKWTYFLIEKLYTAIYIFITLMIPKPVMHISCKINSSSVFCGYSSILLPSRSLRYGIFWAFCCRLLVFRQQFEACLCTSPLLSDCPKSLGSDFPSSLSWNWDFSPVSRTLMQYPAWWIADKIPFAYRLCYKSEQPVIQQKLD